MQNTLFRRLADDMGAALQPSVGMKVSRDLSLLTVAEAAWIEGLPLANGKIDLSALGDAELDYLAELAAKVEGSGNAKRT